jgi:hypothetical protein
MSKNDNNPTDFKSLYKRLGYSQKGFAEVLSRRFEEIGSARKVTIKSIGEWNRGVFEPRMTPRETLEMCLLLKCNLFDLVLAIEQTKTQSQTQSQTSLKSNIPLDHPRKSKKQFQTQSDLEEINELIDMNSTVC